MTDLFDLSGKIALVTGAASGLGRQFALTLARQGADIALAGRRTERLAELAEEIRSLGRRAVAVRLDVTETASIQAAAAEIEAALGPIDILINNSGVSAVKAATDTTPEDYDFVMNTNVKGAFFVATEIGRRMIGHKRGGRIVNIASVAGLKAMPMTSVYCISKAAVIHMTKTMALEWARYNINVNALCPGYILTDINAAHFQSEAGAKHIASFPRRRIGEPADLDTMLLALVAPASRLTTGAIITVDDGAAVF